MDVQIRIPKLWHYLTGVDPAASLESRERYDRMVKGVLTCDPNAEDVVVYVSKVFAADREVALPARSIAHIRYRRHLCACVSCVRVCSKMVESAECLHEQRARQ